MLFIEDDMLSGGTLSPVLLDLGKGHKSDGDAESPPSASQVINNSCILTVNQGECRWPTECP